MDDFFLIKMNKETSIFCGPYSMNPNAHIGVGHGRVLGKVLFFHFDPLKILPINHGYFMPLIVA
jgi:hypothetical protein